MRSIVLILFLITVSQLLFGQTLISKDSAISIAIKNGLKEGLEEPRARLVNDSTWMVSCLPCDDEFVNYQVFKINATTGKTMPEERQGVFEFIFDGGQIPKTMINYPANWDSIPKKNFGNEPQKLTSLNDGNESNPLISSDNSNVAFEYGNRKIGVINTDGQNFEKICDECLYPQWIDNEWISYYKDFMYIYKKSIISEEEIQITKTTERYDDYQISPDYKWIAYTSGEVWYPPKDSLGLPLNFHFFINGDGQELCLLSTDGKIKKFVTKTGKYVHTPCWSAKGDSLFFYIGDTQYFATDFTDETITYCRKEYQDKLSLYDYRKVIDGVFPYKYNCQIYEVGIDNMEFKYLLVSKPGRYDNLVFSEGLGYLVYTKKECKTCDNKLWIFKLK